jgi:hypothetical protein
LCTLHSKVGFTVIAPNATRWNSHFDAVDKVLNVVRTKSDVVLNEVCEALQVPLF